MDNITPVIFRKEKNGDILAVFPLEPADYKGNMTCYAHIGQHGGISLDYYWQNTKPAKPEEYQDLLNELKAIGYDNLKIYRRRTK